MGPSFGEAEQSIQATGKDVYLVVDLSASMDATDVVPSRIEKVKHEINKITSQIGNNRIGLIVYSNQPYVQSPLTYDKSGLQLFIQTLSTSLLPQSGSNVCDALALVSDKILRDTLSNDRNKMIVLFSDGEQNFSCSNNLYNDIRRYGIDLFVVGVGTMNGSSIPTESGYLLDKNGNRVISRLNKIFLTNIVNQSRGLYFSLNNDLNEIPQLIDKINATFNKRVDMRTIAVTSDKYYYFLGLGLLFLLLDIIFTIRTFKL
jgi:Ca-activated chloride channel family protein